MNKIIIKSPAKINLTLDVFSKKEGEDFHEIKTIFHQIDFFDKIEISKNDRFKIVGDFDFPTDENLIWKAWKLIENFVDSKDFHPVNVSVEKNIPQGGGLGGGSSNFANFIKGYFQLFNLGEIPERLIQTSAEYGKDIPFFFQKKRCVVGTHFGEVIEQVPFSHDVFKEKRIYLYIPKFLNNTASMYKQLSNFNTNYTDKFLEKPHLVNCGNSFNEFLNKTQYQKLFKTSLQLQSTPFISGSGSCFFSFDRLKVMNCREVICFL